MRPQETWDGEREVSTCRHHHRHHRHRHRHRHRHHHHHHHYHDQLSEEQLAVKCQLVKWANHQEHSLQLISLFHWDYVGT